jgi:hypothetical protein
LGEKKKCFFQSGSTDSILSASTGPEHT